MITPTQMTDSHAKPQLLTSFLKDLESKIDELNTKKYQQYNLSQVDLLEIQTPSMVIAPTARATRW